jgi:membrane protein YqaA with SNARE-associated domain
MADMTDNTGKQRGKHPAARTALVAGEVVMILAILAAWLVSEEMRTGSNLLILFLYSFPSEFLVGLVPHEPVLIWFGNYHPALTVALVAGVSTVIAEGMNYSFFGYVSDTALFERMRRKPSVERIVALFGKAPFLAIIVAGFTPVPFFPVRFLVVMGKYSVLKYMAGVFISRVPRFYILAAAGETFHIPGWVIAAIFAVMIATVNIPLVLRLFGHDRNEAHPSGPEGQSTISNAS